MMIKNLIICFLLTPILGMAQTADVNNFGQFHGDVSPAHYDAMLAELNERNASECYERFEREFVNFEDDNFAVADDATSDEVYAKRLKMLATEIQLPYNPVVKSYIQRYLKYRGTFERILGVGKYYFPIFEKALYDYGLPMELKMLPVIESALTPKAASRASAVGLWQFMLPTGKYYGLEVNSFVDERCDPVKSTDAACRYLSDLYEVYGDWTLVIAAYNCGPGNVNRALKRAPNAKTYWDIWDYLPRETRGYVPTFIAATYVYTFYKAHQITPANISLTLATDTVVVRKLMHFEQISSTIGLPVEVIRDLNPHFLIDIVPATDAPYPLILPQQDISRFIERENDIYSKDTTYLAKYLNISNLSTDKMERVAKTGTTKAVRANYKVKSGDTLGHIAARYHVSVKQIQTWNGLKNTMLKLGQIIKIY